MIREYGWGEKGQFATANMVIAGLCFLVNSYHCVEG